MSLTTSSIFCAARASPAMSALVDCASVATARTTSVARTSWLLISAIDLSNSSAAVAATSTLPNASFEVSTAPAVCAVVSFEVADRAVAVDFIAATLSATVCKTPSRLSRNQAIASSTTARRASCSPRSAFLRSAERRSVMSSWVPTQYLEPRIARLTTEMARPSGDSVTKRSVSPEATLAISSAQY